MVEIYFDKKFTVLFSKIKDELVRTKIKKQVRKVSENPNVGKPMKYCRKGTRELYIKPFRISYVYLDNENKIVFLDLYHKKYQ